MMTPVNEAMAHDEFMSACEVRLQMLLLPYGEEARVSGGYRNSSQELERHLEQEWELEAELVKAGSDVSPALCVSGVVVTSALRPAAFSATDDDPCSLEDGITVVEFSIHKKS
ncbi:hypothetical protein MRX96_015546 [Rhipicephalus microplus]